MKILKTLLTSSLIASVVITGTAQAEQLWDDALYNMVYSVSSETLNVSDHKRSTQVGILSYGDNYNKNSVWSSEYEQYVNPADFKQADIASIGGVNQYLGSNPTAAGKSGANVFIYNETAGEYHLQ